MACPKATAFATSVKKNGFNVCLKAAAFVELPICACYVFFNDSWLLDGFLCFVSFRANCSEYFPIFIIILWVSGLFFSQGRHPKYILCCFSAPTEPHAFSDNFTECFYSDFLFESSWLPLRKWKEDFMFDDRQRWAKDTLLKKNKGNT